MKPYQPSQKTLEKYADVLVNYALNGGKGLKKGEVVRVVAWEESKPLYYEIQKAVLKKGGHLISSYRPNNDKSFNFSKLFFTYADKKQLTFFPEKYLKGLADTVDHSILILSETDKHALQGVDPNAMMTVNKAMKPFSEWLNKKENKGEYSWTLALYGTEAEAREAGLSLKEFWGQIIKACYLNESDPIGKWRESQKTLEKIRARLNKLPLETLHVTGEDVDLVIRVGEKRKWMGGSGRNIPSFELFLSPDWRGTQGWIRFNQPLYRYGNLIEGIKLEFKDGKVIRSRATKNEKLLKEMIKSPDADKVGEFSLTDKRFSRITKFMAETLYDENFGGKYGNTHIALGKSYQDGYDGDPSQLKPSDWKRLGFNDSAVHTDIISTSNRTVTARMTNGEEKVIYKDGVFVI